MIRIALVDDDIKHISLLKSYIEKCSKEENLSFEIWEFSNGLNFLDEYDGNLDVVFLDIEMPHLDGIETAKKIRQKAPSLGIVFVTNMAQYAIKGYEVNAIDFIVKPVEYFVFTDKLKKAIRFSDRNREKEIIIETDNSVSRLRVSQIVYVEKDKNYLLYHTKEGAYRMRGTMLSVEEVLTPEGFTKCNSGCIVNLRYVTRVERDSLLVDGYVLPVSRQRRKAVKEDFMKYIGGVY